MYNKVFLICILLVASFYRLYHIMDYMTFLGDEGRDVLIVYRILHGNLTLLGPTASVGGFFLGPIYYYFMAPFLWLFNYNPVGPAVMVALFGIATVWLIYKVGKELFGVSVGLVAASLYAIAPLVIAYSRSSWNPNLMPFFSLLSLYFLYKALKKNNNWFFIICGLLLGIAMQVHYLTVFLGAVAAFYVLTIQKSISKAIKSYLLILLGFIVGWFPFLAFEIRHGFTNIQSIAAFILEGKDTGASNNFSQIVYGVFFRVFGRLITYFPPPEQITLGLHKSITVWYYATLILGAASVLTVIRLKNSHQKILLLIWLSVGILLFGFYKKPIYDYYFGFMFPVSFLFVALLLTKIYSYRGLIGKAAGIGIFGSIVLLNLSGTPFLSAPNRQLVQVEKISRAVLEKTNGKPFNFALIAGGNSDHAYRYFFTSKQREPKTIETLQRDPKRKTVTDQLLVVCEIAECHPLGNSLWEVAGFGRAEIVGEWNVSVVKIFKLEHYSGK